MSWRDYQSNLRREQTKSLLLQGRLWAIVVGIIALFTTVYLLFDREVKSVPAVEEISRPTEPSGSSERPSLGPLVTASDIERGLSEIRIRRDGADLMFELTIDQGIQKFIEKKLQRNKVDWAGVAVIDAGSGEVLALASHSEKNPGAENLALRSTFPAASIFKVVTAAAAVGGKGYRYNSKVHYSGGLYYRNRLNRRELLRRTGKSSRSIGDAFAHSTNVVFGKLGVHYVGGDLLRQFAGRFGFDSKIPFELPLGESRVTMASMKPAEEARLAAGFGNVTLSPLHGAMIAGAIANDGQMMEPYLVRRVTDRGGEVRYLARQQVWQLPLKPKTAVVLRRMMEATVAKGTAKAHFRRVSRDKILSQLELGGKTGSLTGKNPRGRTEWFVGYARSQDRRLAIGVVTVSERVWRVKPARLARDIFRYAFSPRPIIEARVNTSYGP